MHPFRAVHVALAAFLPACGSNSDDFATQVPQVAVSSRASTLRFVDVTSAAGIDFHHTSGRSGRKYAIETIGSGAAFFDYDNDGGLDLYVVNGADLPGHVSDSPARNALYHNGGAAFIDVAARQVVADTTYGMGCTVGDYDNDGDEDLFVTNYGPNILYRNEGPQQHWRYADVSHETGVAGDDSWSTGCGFADYDLDGDLDLYVANYLDYDLESDDLDGAGELRRPRRHLAPTEFPGRRDVLYRNDGGRFVDVTEAAGLASLTSRELGLLFLDYDADGDVDLFQGNDATPNFLFRNDGLGTFIDVALTAGVAYNESGRPEGTMGVDAADVDGDGRIDLVMTNFQWESNTLYRNVGGGRFADTSVSSGLAASSFNRLAFGINFFDADADGDVDLFVANGHIDEDIERFDPQSTYGQQDQLFANDGHGLFTEVTQVAGPAFEHRLVGRGSATGDYDDDGDLDIFVVNSNQPAVLLRNDSATENHWLSVRLRGTRSNRNGFGARVLVRAGDLVQVNEARSTSSYLSQDDPRLFFGLGPHEVVERLEITWPSGTRQVMSQIDADRTVEVHEPARRHPHELARAQGSPSPPAPSSEVAGDADLVDRVWARAAMVLPDPVLENATEASHNSNGQAESAADRLVELAGALRDRGDFQSAERTYREAIEIHENVAAWTGLGQNYGRLGKIDDARLAFERAVDVDPTAVDPHYELGNLLARRQMFDRAAPHYERAVALAPEHLNAHINLAGLHTRQTDYGPAQEVLRRAISSLPQVADLHYRLGRIYFLQARHAEALATLEETLRLEPGILEAYDLIAQIHMLDGQVAAARDVVASGLQIDSTDSALRTRMGALQFSEGHRELALVDLRRAIRDDPDNAEAYYLLGRTCIELGREALGEAYLHCFRRLQDNYRPLLDYKTAIVLNPNGVQGFFDLGAVYSRIGRYEAARQAYTVALRIDPDHVDARNNLGNIYLRRGELDAAINSYRLVIESDPGYAKAHNNLGYALVLAGSRELAVAEFEKALSLDPDYVQARLNLEEVLRQGKSQ